MRAPSRVDFPYHERIVIGARHRDRHESLVDDVQQPAHGLPPLAPLVQLHKLVGNVDRRAKLNHGPRPELVRVKVVHAAGDNLDVAVWVRRERP